MSKLPTLQDVADAAGVSYATADRVLNARGNVAAKSAAKVRKAIETLGYVRDRNAANLSRRRRMAFRLLLPDSAGGFFETIRAAIDRQKPLRAAQRIQLEIASYTGFDPVALVREIDACDPAEIDGVAVVATDAPEVTRALVELRGRGVPVVTLVSDTDPAARAAYVGMDNVAAGRAAARLLGLFQAGRRGAILPVLGDAKSRDHADRLAGFREVVVRDFPHLSVLDPVESQDDPTRVETLVTAALRSDPPAAIYSIGAGNRGLVSALQHVPVRPRIVVHELGAVSRQALERDLIDAVIDQNPAVEVAEALDLLTRLADGTAQPALPADLTPRIYLRDNLPELSGDAP
ncbi:LacI family DNA-binding transcriptional regulator [Roseobacter sp. HKCCA0434]|uniref:LacI family DNA-binding transcriptional regulator n=1 Tax=Roseobacter sp. HKCCA0434 TaxID=3079297 RepID=UPI002905B8D9|nr:LacI family DNA-binding transcriptional regulator [Roseobacter sp. HKCCA0434]